jgi:putative ABC transport system permease protein
MGVDSISPEHGMTTLLHDLRHSARTLSRNRGFSTVAILTLALGIGAVTTIFSFVNAVLLTPLRYPDSGRLFGISPPPNARFPNFTAVTPGDFLDWQARNHSFADITAYNFAGYNLVEGGEPVGVLAAAVTDRFAETIGVAPELGQSFSSQREGDRAQTVIISDRLWRQRFQSDPRIIGRSLAFDGMRLTVIGVMPDWFTFPRELAPTEGARVFPDVDLWVPLTLTPGERGNALLQVVARLKPGVTLEQARLDMSSVARAIAQDLGVRPRSTDVQIVSLQDRVVRTVRPLLLVVFGAVVVLQLIACVNVANLLLARAMSRRREVAVRSALGSGRGRLIQQHLTESFLLALIGGAAGLLAAVWGVTLVSRLIPARTLPRIDEVHVNATVLAFTVVVSLVSGVVFGLAPAIRAAGSDPATELTGTAGTQSAPSRTLGYLVIAEVALAFVLLAGAGLLLKSFVRLTSVDPGFKAADVATIGVTLPETRYPTSEPMRAFAAKVVDDMRHVPGVTHAAAVNWLPIAGSWLTGDFTVEGHARAPAINAVKSAVSPDYFDTMAIPLLEGRDFNAHDGADTQRVAIVTEGLARTVWPGESAIGKRLRLGFGPRDAEPWIVVVGVVRDIKQTALDNDPNPAIYVPLDQAPRPFLIRSLAFLARTADGRQQVSNAVREQIRRADALLAVGRVRTMRELIGASVSEPRFRALLLGGFAASALILITVGMLGVLGYAVVRRTREIGIRMAIGARSGNVTRLVVAQALKMTMIGIACGVGLALLTTRLLERFLFDVRPRDPGTLVAAGVVIGVLALVASYLPARRATQVDPLVTLRAE